MDKEDLKYLIGRYDHYYDSINNKSQFFLGLNTFIIGSGGALYAFARDGGELTPLLKCCICIIIVLATLSAAITLYSILPYLKSKKGSLIFFGSVAMFKDDEYENAARNCSEAAIYKDLSTQVNHLAKGLIRKYKLLRLAGWILFAEFLVIPAVCIFHYLFNI
jgi:hypothetical protein